MKVSVCMTKTYYYDVEVPNWITEKDEDGELLHEALLIETCYEADAEDPEEWESNIISIYTEDGKEGLYFS